MTAAANLTAARTVTQEASREVFDLDGIVTNLTRQVDYVVRNALAVASLRVDRIQNSTGGAIFRPQGCPQNWGWMNCRELNLWCRYRRFWWSSSRCGIQRRRCLGLMAFIRRYRRRVHNLRCLPLSLLQMLHVVQLVVSSVVWRHYFGRLLHWSATN